MQHHETQTVHCQLVMKHSQAGQSAAERAPETVMNASLSQRMVNAYKAHVQPIIAPNMMCESQALLTRVCVPLN